MLSEKKQSWILLCPTYYSCCALGQYWLCDYCVWIVTLKFVCSLDGISSWNYKLKVTGRVGIVYLTGINAINTYFSFWKRQEFENKHTLTDFFLQMTYKVLSTFVWQRKH